MQQNEYSRMRELEDTHWWYCATRRVILLELKKLSRNKKILDIGCGTGGLMESSVKENFNIVGFDISFYALRLASSRTTIKDSLICASINAIPFADETFDAIVCSDVLYHKQIGNSQEALENMYRLLKSGGVLMLHVPAFEILRGGHDYFVQTKHRFRRGEVMKLFKKSGFKTMNVRYRNFWLFFILIIWRNLANKIDKSDLRKHPGFLNKLLYGLSIFEDFLSNKFLFPVGASIFCTAVK